MVAHPSGQVELAQGYEVVEVAMEGGQDDGLEIVDRARHSLRMQVEQISAVVVTVGHEGSLGPGQASPSAAAREALEVRS